MIKRAKRIKIASVCIVLLLCQLFVLVPTAKAEGEVIARKGVVTSSVNMRSGAGTENAIIATLDVNTVITVLGQTDVSGAAWYNITLKINGVDTVGYAHSSYISVIDDEFEAYLTAQSFPESYKDSLRILHVTYPNWKFNAVQISLNWADVINKESVTGKNLVPSTSDPTYIDLTDVDENGNQKGRDGSSWVAASKAAVEYYMDPRNFLTDPSIFMFECLSYTEGAYTVAGVSNILSGTFMSGSYTCPDTSETYTYADTFMTAAASSGVSPYHLASRARQEQGVNGNSLGLGTTPDYPNIFNFFNIGAYATSTGTAIINGAKYASASGTYGRPWTNQNKSITGGAQFLDSSYINVGQDTIYFQKFNVINTASLYSHQYMSNLKAPASEAISMKKAYSAEILSGTIIFKIPVYQNMPESPVPKPTDIPAGGGDTGGETPVIPATRIVSSSYNMGNGIITGVTEGTMVQALISGITLENGSVSLETSTGIAKGEGTVCTGDVVKILKTDSSMFAIYNLIMYGDINGDSIIKISDLVLIRKHLLGLSNLAGSYYTAADINKDGKVTIADLVFVRKHLLGLNKITQL